MLYVVEWIYTALDNFAGVSAFTISKRISICPATTPTIPLPPTNSFSSHAIQESPSTISKDAAIDCTLADWPLFGCSVLAWIGWHSLCSPLLILYLSYHGRIDR